jgi:hypothetical protein
MSDVRSITIRVLPDGEPQSFNGRHAWALARLVAAGEKGCTPIDHPGPRWSHYVFMLRREGLAIETVDERHGGLYPGRHARYVLRSALEVLQTVEPECAA